MRVKRLALENVRSFLERREMRFDTQLSILIGPNGGGKTNLLDALTIVLRRYIVPAHTVVKPADGNGYWYVSSSSRTEAMILEKHIHARARRQVIEIDIEVTATDIQNMEAIRLGANELQSELSTKWHEGQNPWAVTESWEPSGLSPGQKITCKVVDGSLQAPIGVSEKQFLEYLNLFEIDNQLRSEANFKGLQYPVLYLPVHRAASSFEAKVELASYEKLESWQAITGTTSRHPTQILATSLGMLSRRYRELQEDDNTNAKERLKAEPELQEVTRILHDVGYEWELFASDPVKNQFTIKLFRDGNAYTADQTSSGERELLTYLFGIFGLNVRDAVVIVDEPEQHLHPQWQRILLSVFVELSNVTGNQFVFATHSGAFVSPETVHFVTRISSRDFQSEITQVDSNQLPGYRHLVHLITSQNNERIFFARRVVLVEGVSDLIFFEKLVADYLEGSQRRAAAVEVVAVGGKGLFEPYSRFLRAFDVPFAVIADFDYFFNIVPPQLKGVLEVNYDGIRKKVFDDPTSRDAEALIRDIDQAMNSGAWANAQGTWEYIKSRHSKLPTVLTLELKRRIVEFIESQRKQNIHVLLRGALEAYLPEGFGKNNLERLATLRDKPNLFEELRAPQSRELRRILEQVICDEGGN